MSQAAKPPFGPLLALAILLGLVAAVAGLTLTPLWRASQGYKQQIAELEQRLQTQLRIAAGGAGVQSRLQEIESANPRDAHYLKSSSQTLAAAEIQEVVKRAILSKRGEVLSSQVVGVEQERGAQRVTLGVTLRARLEQVVQIFHLLETGDPFLFIDSTSIRARTAPPVSRIPALQAQTQPLDVQVQLSGYFTPSPT